MRKKIHFFLHHSVSLRSATVRAPEEMAITVALAALLFLWWWISNKSKKNSAPPGPFAIPVLGHLHLLGKDPPRVLSGLARKYGSIMSIKMGMVSTVIVSSPDAAKAVLSTHDINCSSRPKTAVAREIFYNSKDMVWSDYGAHWRKVRKICTVDLFTARRLEDSRTLRMEEVDRLVSSIARDGRDGELPVDMNAKLSLANLNLVSLMAFRQRVEDPEVMEMVQRAIDTGSLFVPGDYFPFLRWMDGLGFGPVEKMKGIHSKLDSVFQKIIDEHRHRLQEVETTIAPDVLDTLLSLDEIDDDDRKGLIMDLFGAGTDTASITTEWALSELMKNPSCMTKARQEIDRVVGHDRVVTEEDLGRLGYIQAVVKETFRLHPAVPLLIPHQSIDSCMVEGYLIPANTRILVNVWSIGRDPRWWDCPEVFDPERFAGDGNGNLIDVRGQHFELLPFGSGRRMCPGMSLGMVMVQIALVRLIQAFDWKAEVEELDMEEEFGITLRKKVPLRSFARLRRM